LSTKPCLVFVCPPFYNYHTLIKDHLILKGYEVILVHDIAEINLRYFLYRKLWIFKYLLKLNFSKKLFSLFNDHKIEVLLVIRGKLLSVKLLEKIQTLQSFKQAHKILYQWDSIQKLNYGEYIKYFNKVISFDIIDSNVLDIKYLPLFFTSFSTNCTSLEYDILVVLSYSKERYFILKKLLNHPCFSNFAIRIVVFHPILSYLKSIIKNENLPFKYISFKPLKSKILQAELSKTKAVLDISHSHQSGLTMRTLETLGNNKKLITNNKYIIDEFFYNKDVIKVYNNIEEIFDRQFIDSKTSFSNDMEKFNIITWVDEILKK